MRYTKTAVSIPQDVFERGEQLAADLGISRSELYARALQALLRGEKITAARASLDAALTHDLAHRDEAARARELHHIAADAVHRAAERGESTW